MIKLELKIKLNKIKNVNNNKSKFSNKIINKDNLNHNSKIMVDNNNKNRLNSNSNISSHNSSSINKDNHSNHLNMVKDKIINNLNRIIINKILEKI